MNIVIIVVAVILAAMLGAGLSLINFGIDEIADPRLRQDANPKKLRKAAA